LAVGKTVGVRNMLKAVEFDRIVHTTDEQPYGYMECINKERIHHKEPASSSSSDKVPKSIPSAYGKLIKRRDEANELAKTANTMAVAMEKNKKKHSKDDARKMRVHADKLQAESDALDQLVSKERTARKAMASSSSSSSSSDKPKSKTKTGPLGERLKERVDEDGDEQFGNSGYSDGEDDYAPHGRGPFSDLPPRPRSDPPTPPSPSYSPTKPLFDYAEEEEEVDDRTEEEKKEDRDRITKNVWAKKAREEKAKRNPQTPPSPSYSPTSPRVDYAPSSSAYGEEEVDDRTEEVKKEERDRITKNVWAKKVKEEKAKR
jgi:hypothetical protein